MPIFEYNGVSYRVKDEHIDKFAEKYPDAYAHDSINGEKYKVKPSRWKAFAEEKATKEKAKADEDFLRSQGIGEETIRKGKEILGLVEKEEAPAPKEKAKDPYASAPWNTADTEFNKNQLSNFGKKLESGMTDEQKANREVLHQQLTDKTQKVVNEFGSEVNNYESNLAKIDERIKRRQAELHDNSVQLVNPFTLQGYSSNLINDSELDNLKAFRKNVTEGKWRLTNDPEKSFNDWVANEEAKKVATEEYNAKIADIDAKIDAKKKELSDARKIAQSTYSIGHMRPTNAYGQIGLVMSRPESQEEKDITHDLKVMNATKEVLQNIYQHRENARRYGEGRVVEDALTNLADSFFDRNTWSFGLKDLSEATALKDVYSKVDRGEALTDAEQLLFDTYNDYANTQKMEVGASAAVGKTVGQMVPFMVEMAINPVRGASGAAAKSYTRAVLQQFGKQAVKNNAKKYVAGKLLTTGFTDLGAGLVMSATTGAAMTEADAQRKMMGDVMTDMQGNYIGRTNQMSEADARTDAMISGAIERQSELLGSHFLDPLTGKMGKWFMGSLVKGENKYAGTFVGKWLSGTQKAIKNYGKTPVYKFFDGINKMTHYNGAVNEYLEEVIGNMERATAGIDGMEFSTEKGKGVFNPEDNAVTFLSVAIPGVAQATINTVATGVYVYNRIDKAQRQGAEMFGSRWNVLKSQLDEIDMHDPKSAYAQMMSVCGRITNTEGRAAALEYVKAKAMVDTFESTSQSLEQEKEDDMDIATNEAQAQGREAVTPEQVRAVGKSLEDAESALLAVNSGDAIKQTIDRHIADGATDARQMSAVFGALDEDARQSAEDYFFASVALQGKAEEVQSRIDAKVKEKEDEIAPYIYNNESGARMYAKATLTTGQKEDKRSRTIYFKDYDSSADKLFYIDEDGSVQIIARNDAEMSDLQEINYDDYINQYREEVSNMIDSAEDAMLSHSPKTIQDIKQGTVIETAQGQMIAMGVAEDGTVTLLPAKMDKSGQLVPVEGQPTTMSMEDAMRMQDEFYEAVPQITESADNMSANQAQNEDIANGESEQSVSKPTVEPIPTVQNGKKSRVAYEQVPVARTIEEVYGQFDEQEEVDEFIDLNIAEAEAAVKNASKPKPKMSTDIEAYKQAKAKWQEEQAGLAEAQKRLDYWKEVKAESERMQGLDTATEISQDTKKEDNAPRSAMEYVASMIGRLDPGSYRKETGYGVKEQRKAGPIFLKKENGGMTVEGLAEWICEQPEAQEWGIQPGMDSEVRDMIIEVLSHGSPKAYIRDAHAQQAKADAYGEEQYLENMAAAQGFASADDMIAHDEVFLAEAIRRNYGLDENEYYANLAEEYEQEDNRKYGQRNERQDNGTSAERLGQGNTTAEVADVSGSSEVLSEEQSADTTGAESGNEQGELSGSTEGGNEGVAENEAVSGESVEQEQDNFIPYEEQMKLRIEQWEKALGVKVVVYTDASQVKSRTVRAEWAKGELTPGWFSNGTAYIFLPHNNGVKSIDETFVHEVVSHKGIKELLGEENFNKFLDKVWDMMSAESRAENLGYVNGKSENEGDRRAAADEYVAHLSEDMSKKLGKGLSSSEKGVWNKIVDFFRNLFASQNQDLADAILDKKTLTDKDIEQMIMRSFESLREKAKELSRPIQETNDTDDLLEYAKRDAERREMLRKVYHGSGASFDKFDHSHMGEGEGAQAFGWGTYVTDVEGIGRTYARSSFMNNLFKEDNDWAISRNMDPVVLSATLVRHTMSINNMSFEEAKKDVIKNAVVDEDMPDYIKEVSNNLIEATKNLSESDLEKAENGAHLYTVEIPDDNGSNYIVYDKDVSKKVKGDVKRSLFDILVEGDYKGAEKELKWELDDVFATDMDGRNLYGTVSSYLGSDKEASQFLNSIGFVGISYPAEFTSGGRSDGARNYVIFNEDDLQIEGHMRFRKLKEVNDKFNAELQQQIDGTLPAGHIYQLGMPSDVLKSAGINDLPIELAASRLVDKSMQENHPFDLAEVENLPNAIHNPLAVFLSASNVGSKVLLTELKHGGKNFVVALRVRPNKKRIKVNQIRSLYPKDIKGILNWINNDLATYVDKPRMIEWIGIQKNELLSKPQSNSVEVRKQLVSATKVIEEFENPKLSEENEETKFKKYKSKDGKETAYRQLSLFDTEGEASNDRLRSDSVQRKGDTRLATLNSLRELEEGEVCNVERRFSEKGGFDFTRGEKVLFVEDVAYIFKNLEDEAIENSFVAFVKGDEVTVMHVGMGAQTMTVTDQTAVIAGAERLNADKVFFVHNHPSGKLVCSREDINLYTSLKMALGDKLWDGIIINTRSGKYGVFNENGIVSSGEEHISPQKEYPLKIYGFNKQAFHGDVVNIEPSSSGIAKFVSTQRLGSRNKINALLLNNSFGCLGNVFLSETDITEKNAYPVMQKLVADAISMGARSIVLYGRAPFVYFTGGKLNLGSRLSEYVKMLSSGQIQLQDVIQLGEGSYTSAIDNGIRFRKAKNSNNLIAVHNISESNLRKVLEMGGLIMPSIAVTDVNLGHSGYGEISLLFDKETINPSDRRNKVYGGDAWTPRFPKMEPKLNGDVVRSVRKKIEGLLDENLRAKYSLSAELHPSNIESTISNNGVEGYYGKEWMKIAYLLDNGKRFKIPMKMKDYGSMAETIIKLAKDWGLSLSDIRNGGYEFYEKNPEFVSAVLDAKNEARLASVSAEDRDKVRELLRNRPMGFTAFDTYIRQAMDMERDLNNGGLKQVIDGMALYEAINKRVKTDNADYNKWVDDLFEGVVEKYGIRNNRDWYTPSGNSRPWEQLYDAPTPANILRYMLAQNDQGGNGGLWDSNIMGASAETYESIEEIREKGKKRLHKVSEDVYDEWATSVANRFSEICDEFMTASQKNDFGGIIDAKIAITNAVAKDKTAKGIYKAMKKQYANFTMEHAKRVEEIVEEIQDYATTYFEAKPQRVVELSEVRKAVVPSNVSSDIVEGLKKNGIEVATYRKGNEQSRNRVIKKESDGIRFRKANRNQVGFVSNAMVAVEGVKQEKATPEQWLKMIEKHGGLKAGEDKWLGLSDWLKSSDKKTLTKDEVLEFIGENMIQIEEVRYKQDTEADYADKLAEFNAEFDELIGLGEEETGSLYTSDFVDYAWSAMVERYGDDFESAFEIDYDGEDSRLVPQFDYDGSLVGAARYFLDIEESNPINSTRLDYTTEGLENRREIALTVPTIESWNESDEIHFGDAGNGRAVAWVRFGETTDADGSKVLVIDEIQSKRHQEGREKGYRGNVDEYIKINNVTVEETSDSFNFFVNGEYETRMAKGIAGIDNVEKAKALYVAGKQKTAVPSAPFEKNWHELAMKRMLRLAAEEGFDKVAWTTGAQQAERYDIGDAVKNIEVNAVTDSETGEVLNDEFDVYTRSNANGGGFIPEATGRMSTEQIMEVFGKDLGGRIVENGRTQKNAVIEGENLRLGGEGMKGFYDKMLPSFVQKYTKKWGAKVGEVTLPNLEEPSQKMWSVDVTPQMKESVGEQVMFRKSTDIERDYPNWLDGTTTESGKHSTQVEGTRKTYNKVGDWIEKNLGNGVTILDASSGMGYGTADLRERGFDIEDVEPYQSDERKKNNPATYSSYDDIKKKYDVVISNAVLNVIPDDWRADVLHDMARSLKEGGMMFINTRKAGEEKSIKDKIELDTPQEVLVKRNGKIASYQKFFTPAELKEWVEGELGEGYSVAVANEKNSGTKGLAAVVVTKEKLNDPLKYAEREVRDNKVRFSKRSIGKMATEEAMSTLAQKYGLNGVYPYAVIDSIEDIESLKGVINDEVYNKLIKSFNDNDSAGVSYINSGVLFLFSNRLHSKEDAKEAYWHENTHIIYRDLKFSDREQYDSAILDWLKRFIPSKYEEIINDYEESDWGEEAAANFIAITIKEYGEDYFFEAKFEGESILTNFAELIQHALKYGARQTNQTQGDKLQRLFQVSTDEGRSGANAENKDRQNRSEQERKRRNAEGAAGTYRQSQPIDLVAYAQQKVKEREDEVKFRRMRPIQIIKDREDKEQEAYNRSLQGFLANLLEAHVDYLRSVRKLQEAIENALGRKIPSYANPYLLALQCSSKNKIEQELLSINLVEPMKEFLRKLVFQKGINYEQINDYLNAKHGLERNVKLADRDAREIATDDKGNLDMAAYQNELQKNRKKDYSGLTDIFRTEEEKEKQKKVDVKELERRAQAYIDEFEKEIGSENVKNLWSHVKQLTNYALEKSFSSNLISKEEYDDMMNTYQYYVPLRGFAEKTAGDVWNYLSDNSYGIVNPVKKTAHGRESKADDILSTIQNMAESSIVQGNRNQVNLALLNLAEDTDTSLLSVRKMWYVKDYTTDEWVISTPKLREGMTSEEVNDAIQKHEEDMRKLQAVGRAKQKKGKMKVQYRIEDYNVAEHGVRVKRGGTEYIVYVNGNPKAAQALNGLLNQDAWAESNKNLDKSRKFYKWLFRVNAKTVTSLSPEFIITNFMRDIQSATTVMSVRHDKDFVKDMLKHVGENVPLTSVFGKDNKGKKAKVTGIYALYGKFYGNTLDANNPREKYFQEFMMNGGETGYTQLNSVEDIKKQMAEIEENALRHGVKGMWEFITDKVEFANRGIENAVRFAAYQTAREKGMPIVEAINEAKEASVNFNRKGSGAMGNATARDLYLFYNPAVQSTYQYAKLVKDYGWKGAAAFGVWASLGAIIPTINMCVYAMFAGGDDDDEVSFEDFYMALTPYKRRNFINFYVGGGDFISITLPIEARVPFGLASIATEVALGKLSVEQAAWDAAGQVLNNILPRDIYNDNLGNARYSEGMTDLIEGVAKGLIPDIPASIMGPVVFNEDFLGRPITGVNKYNDHLPEWQRLGKNTPKWVHDMAYKVANLDGDPYAKEWYDSKYTNPGAWVEVVSNYLPFLPIIKKVVRTYEAYERNDEVDEKMRNMPFASKFMTTVNEDYAKNLSMRNEFEQFMSDVDDVQDRRRSISADKSLGVVEEAQLRTALDKTPEGIVYNEWTWTPKGGRSWKNIYNDIMDEYKEARDNGDVEERKEKMKELDNLRKSAIKVFKESLKKNGYLD